jgi:hypothetical protein
MSVQVATVQYAIVRTEGGSIVAKGQQECAVAPEAATSKLHSGTCAGCEIVFSLPSCGAYVCQISGQSKDGGTVYSGEFPLDASPAKVTITDVEVATAGARPQVACKLSGDVSELIALHYQIVDIEAPPSDALWLVTHIDLQRSLVPSEKGMDGEGWSDLIFDLDPALRNKFLSGAPLDLLLRSGFSPSGYGGANNNADVRVFELSSRTGFVWSDDVPCVNIVATGLRRHFNPASSQLFLAWKMSGKDASMLDTVQYEVLGATERVSMDQLRKVVPAQIDTGAADIDIESPSTGVFVNPANTFTVSIGNVQDVVLTGLTAGGDVVCSSTVSVQIAPRVVIDSLEISLSQKGEPGQARTVGMSLAGDITSIAKVEYTVRFDAALTKANSQLQVESSMSNATCEWISLPKIKLALDNHQRRRVAADLEFNFLGQESGVLRVRVMDDNGGQLCELTRVFQETHLEVQFEGISASRDSLGAIGVAFSADGAGVPQLEKVTYEVLDAARHDIVLCTGVLEQKRWRQKKVESFHVPSLYASVLKMHVKLVGESQDQTKCVFQEETIQVGTWDDQEIEDLVVRRANPSDSQHMVQWTNKHAHVSATSVHYQIEEFKVASKWDLMKAKFGDGTGSFTSVIKAAQEMIEIKQDEKSAQGVPIDVGPGNHMLKLTRARKDGKTIQRVRVPITIQPVVTLGKLEVAAQDWAHGGNRCVMNFEAKGDVEFIKSIEYAFRRSDSPRPIPATEARPVEQLRWMELSVEERDAGSFSFFYNGDEGEMGIVMRIWTSAADAAQCSSRLDLVDMMPDDGGSQCTHETNAAGQFVNSHSNCPICSNAQQYVPSFLPSFLCFFLTFFLLFPASFFSLSPLFLPFPASFFPSSLSSFHPSFVISTSILPSSSFFCPSV